MNYGKIAYDAYRAHLKDVYGSMPWEWENLTATMQNAWSNAALAAIAASLEKANADLNEKINRATPLPWPVTDHPTECFKCKWTGNLSDTTCQEVSTPPSAWQSLAGREGWEFFCPKCGMLVDSHYTRMS